MDANGEKNLTILLQQLEPELNDGEYVFCTLQENSTIYLTQVLFSFKEKEGLTVVLPREAADKAALPYSFVSSWITLKVHSSLEAVGLTAAFSTALAKAGISCNVVAAFYHDHIFVPAKDAKKAMQVLKSCASQAV
ncbi:ACT domain-containing protein [Pontibacter diazotrophicus]|uniref:ACT domain-containing protein n=1 Tax=Pontibacter diazotrophicus TaxID=1400979 RepID=A0A3D8LF03_9BACT|nr:ACT domain-containing protein [Pontibacter diazotrophicus]RDV16021.1 ACT domain-containing protein [Pontibacter diazotrophicus]